jgi:hypothetical protein
LNRFLRLLAKRRAPKAADEAKIVEWPNRNDDGCFAEHGDTGAGPNRARPPAQKIVRSIVSGVYGSGINLESNGPGTGFITDTTSLDDGSVTSTAWTSIDPRQHARPDSRCLQRR